MRRSIIPFAVLFLLILGASLASVQAQDSATRNIVEKLSTADSTSGATVRIYQDKRIEQLLSSQRSSGSSRQTSAGYRVQVFSSNVQRTAKSDAFRLERQLRENFPEQGVYVNYFSPFWKVRVGDFKTQAQAQAFRSELINSFPQLRSEAYIVKEQINVSGK